jgi:hypothetical protein
MGLPLPENCKPIGLRGLAALSLAIIVVAGCNSSSLPTKRVEGQITFKGELPPKPGEIYFAAVESFDNLPRRPASGTFDTSGRFTLTSFTLDDGLLPGTYQANVVCWREPPTLATKLSANYVPPDFRPEFTIRSDASEPVVLEIDVPRINEK